MGRLGMGFSITKVVPQHCNPPTLFFPFLTVFVRKLDIRCINSVYPKIHAGDLFLLSSATLIMDAAAAQTNISGFN